MSHPEGTTTVIDGTIPVPTAGEMIALRHELAARAEAGGILDVTYRVIDSPHGRLLLAATDQGLVRIAFEREDHDTVLASLATSVSPRILASHLRTEEAARQLDEYFSGRRQAFDLAVDLRLVDGFRRTVVGHLPEIPYGSTATYASLAQMAGNPKAVRAAGSACANNPVPIVVPCHRVVRSDGKIGNYLGGTEMKAALLAMERAA